MWIVAIELETQGQTVQRFAAFGEDRGAAVRSYNEQRSRGVKAWYWDLCGAGKQAAKGEK